MGDLRGGEALEVAKAVSPPRAPPLWPRPAHVTYLAVRASLHTRPRADALWAKHPQRTVCPKDKRLRRAFASKGGEQPVSQSSGTKFPHTTAKRAQRRGVLGGSVRASQLRARSPLRSSLSFQHEEKIFIQTTKTVLQSSYIKNDNPH